MMARPSHTSASNGAASHQIASTERDAMRLYRRLAAPHRARSLGYCVLLLLPLGLQFPVPFFFSEIIDALGAGTPFSALAPTIAIIAGLSMAGLALSTLSQTARVRLDRRFMLDTRIAVFDALQAAPLRFARTFNVSDLHTRLTVDLDTLNHLTPAGLATLGRHVIALVLYGGMLMSISSTIVLYIAWLLPVATVLFHYGSARLKRLANAAQAGQAVCHSTILESLSGMREARVTGSGRFQRLRLANALAANEERFATARIYSARLFGALGAIPVLVTVLIWSVGAWKIDSGELSIGDLVSFMLVLSMLYGPVNALFNVASGYVFEVAAFGRVAAVFPSPGLYPSAPPSASASPLAAAPAVRIRALDFGFGEQLMFSNFNVQLAAGRCTRVRGPNGAGKSTLLALLAGLEEPRRGQVLLDNRPVASLDAQVLASQVGYVPQDGLVFGDSLRANITMGRPLSDERIHATAAELGLSGFLDAWPAGLDTILSENGRGLSGGQRQKIVLLRATVNAPVFLMLDEPEHHLDQPSLTALTSYLASRNGSTTVILVSHGSAFDSVVDHTLTLRRPGGSDAEPACALSS